MKVSALFRDAAHLGSWIVPAATKPNTFVTLWCSGLVFACWLLGALFQWPGSEGAAAAICAICGFSVVRARWDRLQSDGKQAEEPPDGAATTLVAAPAQDSAKPPVSSALLWFSLAVLQALVGFGIGCSGAPSGLDSGIAAAEKVPPFTWQGAEVTTTASVDPSGHIDVNGNLTISFAVWKLDLDAAIQWTSESVGGCVTVAGVFPICAKFDRATGGAVDIDIGSDAARPGREAEKVSLSPAGRCRSSRQKRAPRGALLDRFETRRPRSPSVVCPKTRDHRGQTDRR